MPAESFSNRLPQNVPGKFYVDDACLDCDLCRETAPTVFRRDDEKGVAYVFHQPETEEELALAAEAVRGCPCEAIFDDGDRFDWSVPRGSILPAWLRGEAPKPGCSHCSTKAVAPPAAGARTYWWFLVYSYTLLALLGCLFVTTLIYGLVTHSFLHAFGGAFMCFSFFLFLRRPGRILLKDLRRRRNRALPCRANKTPKG
jgi:ferredoxin